MSGQEPEADPVADTPPDRVPDQVRRPRGIVAGRYGHPTHAALVAVPIGAFVAAAVFDIASLLVSSEAAALASGATWLLGIGVLGGLAAAATGFVDLLSIPGGTRVQQVALLHAGVNITGVTLFAVDFGVRLADPPAGPVPVGLMVLTVVGLAFLGLGGFLGGEMAYRFGVRVADEATQAEGYRTVRETRT